DKLFDVIWHLVCTNNVNVDQRSKVTAMRIIQPLGDDFSKDTCTPAALAEGTPSYNWKEISRASGAEVSHLPGPRLMYFATATHVEPYRLLPCDRRTLKFLLDPEDPKRRQGNMRILLDLNFSFDPITGTTPLLEFLRCQDSRSRTVTSLRNMGAFGTSGCGGCLEKYCEDDFEEIVELMLNAGASPNTAAVLSAPSLHAARTLAPVT
ncbi:unnamed protein product, partial [Amoebophrya sp. A25]